MAKKTKDTSTEYDDFVGKKEEIYEAGSLDSFFGEGEIQNPTEVEVKDMWKNLWVDMPAHKCKNTEPVKQLIVNFRTWEDYAVFLETISAPLTAETKKTYFPWKPNMDHSTIRWVDFEEDNEE